MQTALSQSDACATAASDQYVVNKVTIIGNVRIPDASVLYYLNMHQGRTYTIDQISNMIRQAYATGFFKKITVDYLKKQGEVIIDVIEQPVIKDVELYGNRKINDKDIKAIIRLNQGLTFSETKLKSDVENILQMYQKRGMFNAIVNPKIIDNKNDTITIAYEIKEGSKAVIEKISFVGNGEFSGTDLKQSILSAEWRLYRFFSNSYIYDQDRLQIDAEIIKEYYQTRGYPNARVVDIISTIDAAKKAFAITFVIDAGEKYDFGSVTVENNIRSVNSNEINKVVDAKIRDKPFDINKVREMISKITGILAGKGYAFVDVDYKVKTKDGVADVIITIKESSRFFINRINISNNIKTYDKVIRREMRISEGDSYDLYDVERSLQRIKNLGYFSDVELSQKQVTNTDKVNLDFSVKEKNTASGLFNIGYSTVSGPFFGFNASEPNLFGTGRMISTGLQVAKRDKAFDFSISEPYFMGFNAISGIGLFFDKRTYKQFVGNKSTQERLTNDEKLALSKYATMSWGFTVNTTYSLTEYLQHEVHYGVKLERLNKKNAKDIMTSISPFLRPDMQTHTISSVGHGFVYDKTDSTIKTTKGYVLKLHQEFAGVGGNAKYMQNELVAAHYTPIYKDKVVLKMLIRGGTATGLGRKIRISDNFFSRDDMIRGFAYNGIGARDTNTFDALGGKNYFAGTAELKFPIGLPNEIDISGTAFVDTATLYKIDVPYHLRNIKYHNSSDIRSSYGVGIIWGSPLGLIRVSYGIPIAKKNFDQVERINFSFGRSF